MVFLLSGYSPIGTDDVDADFAYELAHETKDAGTASETKSLPERRVFKVLVKLQHRALLVCLCSP